MTANVECPTCGSPVSSTARFCPVCQRPRRAVEQQLRDAAETTSTPYETLLQRAQDDNERNPQPFTPPVVDDPAQYNEPPPSTRAWWKPITAVFIAVVVIVAIGSAGDDDASRTTARRPASSNTSAQSVSEPSTYRVQYRVTMTGASGMGLTYENAQGGSEQVKVNQASWTKTYVMSPGQFAYISAQNQQDHGSIKCDISIDGRSWKTSTSQGAYTIATCSGSVGRD